MIILVFMVKGGHCNWESFEILQWMRGVFYIMYMNSFIMSSSELGEKYPSSISQCPAESYKNFRMFLDSSVSY